MSIRRRRPRSQFSYGLISSQSRCWWEPQRFGQHSADNTGSRNAHLGRAGKVNQSSAFTQGADEPNPGRIVNLDVRVNVQGKISKLSRLSTSAIAKQAQTQSSEIQKELARLRATVPTNRCQTLANHGRSRDIAQRKLVNGSRVAISSG
jgi:hypothetical protein